MIAGFFCRHALWGESCHPDNFKIPQQQVLLLSFLSKSLYIIGVYLNFAKGFAGEKYFPKLFSLPHDMSSLANDKINTQHFKQCIFLQRTLQLLAD